MQARSIVATCRSGSLKASLASVLGRKCGAYFDLDSHGGAPRSHPEMRRNHQCNEESSVRKRLTNMPQRPLRQRRGRHIQRRANTIACILNRALLLPQFCAKVQDNLWSLNLQYATLLSGERAPPSPEPTSKVVGRPISQKQLPESGARSRLLSRRKSEMDIGQDRDSYRDR